MLGLGLFLILSISFFAGCDSENIKNSFLSLIDKTKNNVDISSTKQQETVENPNPVFKSQEDLKTDDQTASQIDQLMRKSLGKVFSDVKLVSADNVNSTPFIMKYMVKRMINQQDGELLHKTLLENESRVKDDSMPKYYDNRNTVELAVYHDFGGRSYILATVMDLTEQVIWVNVY